MQTLAQVMTGSTDSIKQPNEEIAFVDKDAVDCVVVVVVSLLAKCVVASVVDSVIGEVVAAGRLTIMLLSRRLIKNVAVSTKVVNECGQLESVELSSMIRVSVRKPKVLSSSLVKKQ